MKILIADDDIECIRSLGRILKTKGYEIDIAIDGQYALELLGKNEYDIVFLDQNMPDYTGVQLAQYIKQEKIKTRVVMITGFPHIEDSFLKIVGIDEFIEKPYHVEDIENILKKYTE
ncbi:MAG: response regulator [Endomicrobiales bacterium]|nr:response regulator [Endomicrobiales bacterium]